MTPEDFLRAYEAALATQSWKAVEPLIHPEACVTFSSGAVHEGRDAVREAYSRNFTLIKGETYHITNVRWVHRGEEAAVGLFDYEWTGIIAGRPAGGRGRGTTALLRTPEGWKLIAEHLGPRPE